jgi:hypothetical protein
MYVIENDNGEVLDRICYEFTSDVDRALLFDEPIAPAEYAKRYGGHVIELVEKQEPVVVSEEEAKLLKRAKGNGWRVAGAINQHMRAALPSSEPFDVGTKLEDRLMRAYVNGWTVEKPKRYIVLMRLPGKKGPDDNVWHYMRAMRSQQGDYIWWSFADADGTCKSHRNDAFTAAEIEHYGLQDCDKEEVTDDEQ